MQKTVLAKDREKSSTSWEDIPANLQKSVLDRIGTSEQPQFLDAGSQGSVYETSDGKILKITNDMGEANAAEIVRSAPFHLIYPVDDVFEIGNNKDLFGILMPKMDPADRHWVDFCEIFNSWHTFMSDELKNKFPDDEGLMLYLVPKTMDMFRKYIETNFSEDDYSEQLDWLYEITKYLNENGILFLDVHGGNVMINPETGEHVLIDLGYSETKPVKLPVVISTLHAAVYKLIATVEILLNKNTKK